MRVVVRDRYVPFDVAATMPHSGSLALLELRAAGPLRAGERVLVNGAGGCVGPFAVQIAKERGAVVTAVDHGDKLDLLRGLGADEVLDHTRQQDVTRAGRRFDVVLDIADTRSVLAFRRCLAPEPAHRPGRAGRPAGHRRGPRQAPAHSVGRT